MGRARAYHHGLIPAAWYVLALPTFILVRASAPFPASAGLPMLPATLSQPPLPVPTAVILNIYCFPQISHPPPAIMASAESCLLIHREKRGCQMEFFLRLAFLPTQNPPAFSPAFPFPFNSWAETFFPPPKAEPSSVLWKASPLPCGLLWALHSSISPLFHVSPAPSFPALFLLLSTPSRLSFLTPSPTEKVALNLNPPSSYGLTSHLPLTT